MEQQNPYQPAQTFCQNIDIDIDMYQTIDPQQPTFIDSCQSVPVGSDQFGSFGARQSAFVDSHQFAPFGTRQSASVKSCQSGPFYSRQFGPLDSRKFGPRNTHQYASVESIQFAPVNSQKIAPVNVLRTAPVDTFQPVHVDIINGFLTLTSIDYLRRDVEILPKIKLQELLKHAVAQHPTVAGTIIKTRLSRATNVAMREFLLQYVIQYPDLAYKIQVAAEDWVENGGYGRPNMETGGYILVSFVPWS